MHVALCFHELRPCENAFAIVAGSFQGTTAMAGNCSNQESIMTKKSPLIVAILAVASAATLTACTSTTGEYRTVSIPQGGSRYGTVLVRADAQKPNEAPYALTGQGPTRYRVVPRWAGTHQTGPVLVPERE
jgi:hypothetical protein